MPSKKIIFIIFFILISSTFPQQRFILKPNGQLSKLSTQKILKDKSSEVKQPAGFTDTISYRSFGGNFNTDFKFAGQDVIMQWFQAPANFIIKKIGFNCSSIEEFNMLEIKIYKLNLTKDEIISADTERWGYFISKGNGFNDINPFLEEASEPKTWIPFNNREYFCGDLLWELDQIPFSVHNDGNEKTYDWYTTGWMGYEPKLKTGDIFGIFLRNIYWFLDTMKIGVYSSKDAGYNGFKFYANGKKSSPGHPDTTTWGWWSEPYTFDIALAIDITGCEPPDVNHFTRLPSTLSTEPREVTVKVFWGCSDTIKTVYLIYSINDNNKWIEIPMTMDSEYTWKAKLPGQPPNTKVTYWIKGLFDNGNFARSVFWTYLIFAPTPNVNTLLVFDNPGSFFSDYFISKKYFGNDDFVNFTPRQFDHDIWCYGPLTTELVNYYDNILEIVPSTSGYYNDSVIVPWLKVNSNHNYFLAGQEWLGARYGFQDSTFSEGSFEYDILGITHSFNDVSYADNSGQKIPSRVFPQQGLLLGGPLYSLFNSQPTDSMICDPERISNYENWIDGYEILPDVQADMKVETRGIEGKSKVEIVPCASHRILTAGNRIAFLSYDPLSISSSPVKYWYGFSETAPQVQALKWFGIITNVQENTGTIPDQFSLSQNYPNPFNPTTSIKFRNTKLGFVSLKVYDILGRKVETLVNEAKQAGVYEVEFNASNLPSGIYFCQLKAGDFIQTKKMILLR
ncbi:MAG: T9SS type A sorting domain-containing protein [Ignavibacteriales bacterium]|nr:T9SS type A sorting domain-containing protein [Ignavibacteriales bacterium]